MSDLEQVARQTLGIAPANAHERMQAERNAWAAQCQRAEAEVAELLERNKALQARVDVLGEFCRNTPEMRELIGDLRAIYVNAEASNESAVKAGLRVLLRKIDLESQL